MFGILARFAGSAREACQKVEMSGLSDHQKTPDSKLLWSNSLTTPSVRTVNAGRAGIRLCISCALVILLMGTRGSPQVADSLEGRLPASLGGREIEGGGGEQLLPDACSEDSFLLQQESALRDIRALVQDAPNPPGMTPLEEDSELSTPGVHTHLTKLSLLFLSSPPPFFLSSSPDVGVSPEVESDRSNQQESTVERPEEVEKPEAEVPEDLEDPLDPNRFGPEFEQELEPAQLLPDSEVGGLLAHLKERGKIFAYSGFSTRSDLSSLAMLNATTDTRTILGAGLAYEITRLGEGALWPIWEAEYNFGWRFENGHQDGFAEHTFVPFIFRWDQMPWNQWINTTLAAGEGLSYAAHIPSLERELQKADVSHFMNYLMFELTMALPKWKNESLFFRIHHRSGMFGMFGGADGGSNLLVFGLRLGFR